MNPDVGFILPNYNYATLLAETVESIAVSATAPRMVTFVDDASTDESVAVWEKAKGALTAKGIPHQTIVRSVNGGTAAALNTGIEATRTEWIWPLATDDKLMPHAIDHFLQIAAAGCDHVQMGYKAFQNSTYERLYPRHDNLAVAFQHGKRLSSGCSPFRRVFWEMCPFDERMRGSEDTAFWVRLAALGGRSIPSTKPCVWVRRHYGSSLAVNVRPNRGRIHNHIKTIVASPLPVDFAASERHFVDHLAPMWAALPFPFQGRFIIPETLTVHAQRLGLRFSTYQGSRANMKPLLDEGGQTRLVVTCASGDQRAVADAGHYSVFSEHGAGQSYSNMHDSYAGYPGRRAVLAFVCPGEHPARRNLAAYRGLPIKQIGCPKMDEWQNGSLPIPEGDEVCISFHWDCRVAPESRTAYPHFKNVLGPLASRFNLIGHCHPRFASTFEPVCKSLGIEFVREFSDVLKRSRVYVIDNSSTMFEFAAAAPPGHSRPVVVLNAPWYNRSRKHGLRFWDCSQVGINVDDPADLADAIERALKDDDASRKAQREAILDKVYAVRDGTASVHAANAILSVIRNVPNRPPLSLNGKPRKARYMSGPVKMQALHPWRNKNWEGLIAVGQIFHAKTEERARDLEKRGLAVRFLDPVPVIASATEPKPMVSSGPGLPGPSVLKEDDVPGYSYEPTDQRGWYVVLDAAGESVEDVYGKKKAILRVDELNSQLETA